MSGDRVEKTRQVEPILVSIIVEALGLAEHDLELRTESRILGAIPEFDSMALVAVLTGVEEQFGFRVDDEEISAETFETLGTLAAFVSRKLGG